MTLANSQSERFCGKQEIIRRQKPDKKSCLAYAHGLQRQVWINRGMT